MNVNSTDYQNHKVFISIDIFIAFYESFSDSVMSYITTGTTSMHNIDTYLYTSMSGTLESIKLILKNGRINDAYSLLRKFHDSIILNIYTTLYIEDNLDIENFLVEKIQNWLSGKDNNSIPNFRGMTNYIKDAPQVKEIYDLIHIDKRYTGIRNRCTDNMHYNFYWNVMLNDNKIYNNRRLEYLSMLNDDLEQLVIMHLSYIFYFNEKYMASSDYVDYLDCNLIPPEDSQYWVASYIQDIFDNLIRPRRPDIAEVIKGRTCMKLS
jgi:hypothetical protein